jgi:hypothetical protein
MELPPTFAGSDGEIVVNFGLLTGREVTMAEVDRLAHLVSTVGGKEISIVSMRTHEYSASIEAVIHQVVARSDVISTEKLERLCSIWARECAADRRIAPL